MKGVRFISGREFLLMGRYTSRGRADYVADSLLREWEAARVRKTPHRFGDWSVWVSGKKVAIPLESIKLTEGVRV